MNDFYDAIAERQYHVTRNCRSELIESPKFGSTQIHACSGPRDPAVLLFHAISSSSIDYGDWLVPALVSGRMYAVAVDALCDVGRSVLCRSCKESNKPDDTWKMLENL